MTTNRTNLVGPRFRQFEKVTVKSHSSMSGDECGTVIWADAPQKHMASPQWTYCVFLESRSRYLGVLESNLCSTGQFDSGEGHLGSAFEISYDLLPDKDGAFSFIEGTYRLPGRFWQVMMFTKRDVPTLAHRPTTWHSGITGAVFHVPRGHRLDKSYVERALSEMFGADRWVEVKGPDSMILR